MGWEQVRRVAASVVLLGVGGCGDELVLPPPPPGIRAVAVAPHGVNLQIGNTTQMTATVVRDPGAIGTPTITWASSSMAIATVSPAGLVTGVSVGSVAITAGATLNGSTASGSATVHVTAPQIFEPGPQASIKSITTASGLPVLLHVVGGEVLVTVSLNRDPQKTQTVELLVDGKVVAAEVLQATGAGTTRVEEVVFPWNTAAFDPATGVPHHRNGQRLVAARLFTPGSETAVAPSIALALVNPDFLATTTTVTNGDSTRTPDGTLWWTGDLTVSAVPVVYTAAATVQQIVLTPLVTDQQGNTSLLVSKTIADAPYRATWPKALALPLGGSAGLTGVVSLTTASTINGKPGPGTVGAVTGLVLDNRTAP